jgi:hypothetical protein
VKRIFLAALIGLGMMALILPLFSGKSATRTQQSYPLVCRGSGSLEIRIAPNEGNIGFIFTRGTKPASQGLAPGECSWGDRGMYPGEPDRLSQHVSNGLESLQSEGNTAPENRWYEELHSPNKYWTFMVYNDRQGQMVVTGARPNEGPILKTMGSDDLTLATPGVYSEDGNLYLALPIANVGAAPALRVQIESISIGPGNLLTPATLPADLGDIEPGRRAVLDASFALPNERRLLSLPTRPRLVLTLKGSYSINNQTLSFTLNSVVNIPKASGEAVASRVVVDPDVQQNSPFPAQPLPSPGELEHEQGDVPPVPLGPFRKGAALLDTKVRIPGASDVQGESDFSRTTYFHHATLNEPDPSDDLMVSRNAPLGTNTGNPPDVSGASGSGVVFATANTFGAVSTNDGLTFTTVDPSTIWKNVFSPTKDAAGKLIDGGLCCDQIVRYLPTIDRFVWLLQFWQVGAPKGGLINKVRIAVAKPDDIRTKGVSGPGVWSSWNMTSATFELGENWMDFPDMAVGKNFLYFSVNKVNTGGFVARIPLADLKAGKSLHINYTAAGVCAKMTRNASTEVYWGILSGSSITVYNWREDSDKYSWRTVPLASWSKDFKSYVPAPDPDGKRWIYGAVGFDNVEGAARRYALNPYGGYLFNELWFAWSAGRDAANPYPTIELVRIDAGTFNLIQQVKIKSNDYALTYPDLAANELRGGELVGSDVGMAYLWGGNKYYGNPGVGLFKLGATPGQLIKLDNIELLSAGISNASSASGRSGDYLTVNAHSPKPGVSPPGVFSAFTYRVLKDPTVAGGVRWDSRAIRFGRRSFFTEIPEPPK